MISICLIFEMLLRASDTAPDSKIVRHLLISSIIVAIAAPSAFLQSQTSRRRLLLPQPMQKMQICKLRSMKFDGVTLSCYRIYLEPRRLVKLYSNEPIKMDIN